MRISPLSHTGFFGRTKARTEAKHSTTTSRQQQTRKFNIDSIPDNAVIGYRTWRDGNVFPETAGQFRVESISNIKGEKGTEIITIVLDTTAPAKGRY